MPRTCRQPPTNIFRAAFDEEVITDLSAKAKNGAALFHLGFALPHTSEAAAESAAIAQANALREMQLAQGESPAHVRRVNTKNLCTTFIANEFALVAFCSNVITLLSTLVNFPTTSVDPDEVPVLARCARSLGATIMSGDFKEYRAKHTDTRAFQYFVFNAFNKIWGTAVKTHRDENAIKAALPINCNSRAHEIPARHALAMEALLSDCLVSLNSAMSDTVNIPEVTLYTTSPFGPIAMKAKAEAEAKARRSRTADPPSPKNPGSAKKTKRGETKNMLGAIIFTPIPGKQSNITMPEDWPDEEVPPCLAHLKFESRCCQKPPGTCTYNHKPPLEWCFAAFDSMNRKIKSTPYMAWNPAIVKPSDISLKYSNNKAVPEPPKV